MSKKLFYWYIDNLYVVFWQIINLVPIKFPKQTIAIGDSTKPSILLIPGVFEKWLFLKPIASVLEKKGFTIYYLDNLGYNRDAIPEAATKVRDFLEENNLHNVIIVAHSKGGLIGKYVLSYLNADHRVKRMIAINTPFSGSVYARFVPYKTVNDFSPNSWIIKTLFNKKKNNKEIVSIYNAFDPYIPKSSELEGAKNIQIPSMGHFRILHDKRVQEAIIANCE